MRTPTLFLICSPLLLAACGEVAYKLGASPEALQAAQLSCRAGPLPYPECMSRQGWTLVDMAALNPGLGFAATADNRQAAQTVAEQKTDAPQPAPDALVTVAAWWKFGAGPESLRAALADCAPAGTGQGSHDQGYRITGAQLACMRQAGWHGQMARP